MNSTQQVGRPQRRYIPIAPKPEPGPTVAEVGIEKCPAPTPTFIKIGDNAFIQVSPEFNHMKSIHVEIMPVLWQGPLEDEELDIPSHITDHAYAKKPELEGKPIPRRRRRGRPSPPSPPQNEFVLFRADTSKLNIPRSPLYQFGNRHMIQPEREKHTPRILNTPKTKCTGSTRPLRRIQCVYLDGAEMMDLGLGTKTKTKVDQQVVEQAEPTVAVSKDMTASEFIGNENNEVVRGAEEFPSKQCHGLDQGPHDPTIPFSLDDDFEGIELGSEVVVVPEALVSVSPPEDEDENLMPMLDDDDSYMSCFDQTNVINDLVNGFNEDDIMGPNTSLVMKDKGHTMTIEPQYDDIIRKHEALDFLRALSLLNEEHEGFPLSKKPKMSPGPLRTSNRPRNPPRRLLD